MTRTGVFVCDCQPIVVEGLARVLAASPDLELVGFALSEEEALERLPGLAPDLILLCEDFEAPWNARRLVAMRSVAPQARLVLWTSGGDSRQACMEAGFSGVLDKRRPVEQLLECLRAVARGARWIEGRDETDEAAARRRGPPRLTRRERDIVRLVLEGLKNREIAQALEISPGTVKVHLMHVFEKAGVEDRLQLALLARRLLSHEPEPAPREELEEAVIAPA